MTFRDAGKDLSLFEAGMLESLRKRENAVCIPKSFNSYVMIWLFFKDFIRHAVGMGGRIF